MRPDSTESWDMISAFSRKGWLPETGKGQARNTTTRRWRPGWRSVSGVEGQNCGYGSPVHLVCATHQIVGGTNLFAYGGRVTSLERTPSAGVVSVADPELVDLLAQLSFLVQNALAEIAGEHDLSLTGTRLLGVLRDRKPTMHALGRHLGLDKSSISGLVDRAERRGLVRRSPSMTDRRAFQVSITESGLELADIIAGRFAERVEVLVGDLRDSDRQRLMQLTAHIVRADAARRGSDFATGPAPTERPA